METERNRKCQKDRDMFLKKGGRATDRGKKCVGKEMQIEIQTGKDRQRRKRKRDRKIEKEIQV